MTSQDASAGGRGGGARRGFTWPMAPSLIGVVGGIVYTIAARAYQVGTLANPGPSMFPLFVSVVVIVPSAICLVSEYLHPSASPAGVGPAFWRVPAAALGILAYILLLKPAGFFVAAALLCGALLWILGRRPWWLVVVVAAGTSLVCYFVFQELDVPLPVGVMPF